MKLTDDEKKARADRAAERILKALEAKGHAISIIGDFKRARMSKEEIAEQARKDNELLFGPERR